MVCNILSNKWQAVQVITNCMNNREETNFSITSYIINVHMTLYIQINV